MKKFLQLSILVILAIALIALAFSVKPTSSKVVIVTHCLVAGWHTGPTSCFTPMASLHGLAFQIVLPPVFLPNVGWNG